jgi:hypothetical protein
MGIKKSVIQDIYINKRLNDFEKDVLVNQELKNKKQHFEYVNKKNRR